VSDFGSSFLDGASRAFAGPLGRVAKDAIPSLFTSLIVKKPQATRAAEAAIPLYQQTANLAGRQAAFADQQANAFNSYYLPGAIDNLNRARTIGTGADLSQVMDQVTADFAANQAAQTGAVQRQLGSMGVDPTSGAYGAAMGALGASAVPSYLTTLNAALRSRQEQGDAATTRALAPLNMAPNYGVPASIYGSAAGGLTLAGRETDRQYRQEVADTAQAFRQPWLSVDAYDRDERTSQFEEEMMRRLRQQMSRYGWGAS
jgi:hypothetical protein